MFFHGEWLDIYLKMASEWPWYPSVSVQARATHSLERSASNELSPSYSPRAAHPFIYLAHLFVCWYFAAICRSCAGQTCQSFRGPFLRVDMQSDRNRREKGTARIECVSVTPALDLWRPPPPPPPPPAFTDTLLWGNHLHSRMLSEHPVLLQTMAH